MLQIPHFETMRDVDESGRSGHPATVFARRAQLQRDSRRLWHKL